jgi:hypothetical protein
MWPESHLSRTSIEKGKLLVYACFLYGVEL